MGRTVRRGGAAYSGRRGGGGGRHRREEAAVAELAPAGEVRGGRCGSGRRRRRRWWRGRAKREAGRRWRRWPRWASGARRGPPGPAAEEGGDGPRGAPRLAGGGGGRCLAGDGRVRPARGVFLGFRGGDPRFGMRGLYIGIEGARRVQMRCGFRPRDRDRTTEMMEGV